jgi:hypothetical protein
MCHALMSILFDCACRLMAESNEKQLQILRAGQEQARIAEEQRKEAERRKIEQSVTGSTHGAAM